MEHDLLFIFRGIERIMTSMGGWAIIIMGILVFKWGLSGEANLFIETKRFTFRLLNAGPGVLVTLFGAFLLISNQFNKLEIKDNGSVLYKKKIESNIEQKIERYLNDCSIISERDSVPCDSYKRMIEHGASLYSEYFE